MDFIGTQNLPIVVLSVAFNSTYSTVPGLHLSGMRVSRGFLKQQCTGRSRALEIQNRITPRTHVPSSLLLQKTMKGSDLPKKSFLSSLLAQNCRVALSCRNMETQGDVSVRYSMLGGVKVLFMWPILVFVAYFFSFIFTAYRQQREAAVCESHSKIMNTA